MIKLYIENMVPISRFNKGEAGKIFDEVEKTVLKLQLRIIKQRVFFYQLKITGI